MGRVIRAGGDGLTVHLPEGRRGRVCLSDIHDKYVNNALTGEMLASCRALRCEPCALVSIVALPAAILEAVHAASH